MRLEMVIIATMACASLASCVTDRSTDSIWAIGIWQPVETDYNVLSTEFIEFTGDGMSILYDKNCNRMKEIEFIVIDGKVYVGSRDQNNRFPPAIFQPSDDRTKLIHKVPGSGLKTTYEKARISECQRQG